VVGSSDAYEGLRVIHAEEVLKKIEDRTPINYSGVIIDGDLCFSNDMPKDESYMHFSVDSSESTLTRFSSVIRSEVKPFPNSSVVFSPIEIKDSIIKGVVKFNNTIFQEPIIFINTTFSENVYFVDSQFNKHAYFGDSKFVVLADFIAANFSNSANFNRAKFDNFVSFKGAIFNKCADFTGSYFNGYAEFFATKFQQDDNSYSSGEFNSGERWFRTKEEETPRGFAIGEVGGFNFESYAPDFNSNFCFNKANFIKNANFNGANFSQNVTFNQAKFYKSALFGGAKFLGNVNFEGTNFQGDANFYMNNFTQDADFEEAKFVGNAIFHLINFSKSAKFNESKFGYVRFEDVLFNGSIILASTRFTTIQFGDIAFGEKSKLLLDDSDLIRSDSSLFLVSWNSIKNHIVDNDAVYLSLVNNFRKQGLFDEADDCYYQHRQWKQWTKPWSDLTKLIDIFAWLIYGYSVKPGYPLAWSIFLVLFFGLEFWRRRGISRFAHEDIIEGRSIVSGSNKNATSFKTLFIEEHINFKDYFIFSFINFTSDLASFIHPAVEYRVSKKCKRLAILERLVGTMLVAIFLFTVGRLMIR
jgi:hypothetical protein